MSRRYLNKARPPALVIQLLIFFLLLKYNCSLYFYKGAQKGFICLFVVFYGANDKFP